MTFVNVNPRRRRSHVVNPFFNLFNDVLTNPVGEIEKNIVKSRPAVNVIEGKEDFKLEIAAPGLKKSDFDINVEKDVLTISAKVENEKNEGIKYSRKEFEYNDFKRTFHLPKTIDKTKIDAKFEDGILHLTLAKKEEAKELPARKIAIG
ncbi:MAG: Hsp20/alpha crystallin family protein [Saprospiraceae bacterium]